MTIDLKNIIMQNSYLLYLLSFSIAFVVTILMIVFPINDVPNERSSHLKITPRGAGFGILLAYIGVWQIRGFGGLPFYEAYIYWILCLGVCTLLGIMGFLDDLFNIKESLKLTFQVILVIFLAVNGIRYTMLSLPLFGEIKLGLGWGLILTLLWVVGFMNAFNFMDGLNGMTGVITIIASFFWYLIARQASSEILSFSALILLCANLGFLGFNFPRAFIFSGDVGSLFMGSLFAFWAVLGALPDFGEISIGTVPMLFCLYLYDVIYTRIRRVYQGHPFLSAHREHIYQLLNRTGWSHPQVVLLYGGFFCIQGMAAYYMQSIPHVIHFYFFLPFLAVYSFLAHKVLKKARRNGIHV